MPRLGDLGGVVHVIPGALATAAFVAWAAAEGGFPATSLYPGALFMLGLLAITAIAFRGRLAAPSRWSLIALGLLAAFVAWSFASIAWADDAGIAWDAANRALLYLLVYALFLLLPWRRETATTVLGIGAVGLAGVGAVVLVEFAGSARPELSLIGGRLAEPLGYANAVAALFVGGFWPAAFLASRRELPWPARGLSLAVAGLLLQLALMTQSRGALIVFPIAIAIYLVAMPQRLRTAATLLLAGGATGLAAPAILDVFSVPESGGDLVGAAHGARDAMLISFAALTLLGSLLAWLDRRRQVSAATARLAARAAAVAAGAGLVVAAVAAIAAIGSPVDWADQRWQDFKGGYDSAGFGSSRFGGDLGSNRYDFWRVAITEELGAAPLIGGGADNFAIGYLQDRESVEEPLYPHSLPVRVLAGTGLIGSALLGGFFLLALLQAARRRRQSSSPLAKGVAGLAIGAFAYWALHSSGDWLWTFPAITAPVFAWLGMAAALPDDADRPSPGGEAAPGGARRLITAALLAIGSLLAAVSFLLPWGSARDVEIASSSWGADPAAAYERLDRARDLNFLSARADVTAGTIALSLGDRTRARQSFELALERQPQNWYALLQLGTLDLQAGRDRLGLERLERAAALNPADTLIETALLRAREGDPITSAEIERDLLARVCGRVGVTSDTEFCR